MSRKARERREAPFSDAFEVVLVDFLRFPAMVIQWSIEEGTETGNG